MSAANTVDLFSSRITRQARDMIAYGLVRGWSVVHKFGHNPDANASLESVWPTGGLYVHPTSASILEVFSSAATDTAAGAGARTVTIEGLDDGWAEISDTVSMNGTTPVNTTKSFLRVNRAYVATCGTYGSAQDGDITIRITGGGAVQASIMHTQGGLAWKHGQTELGRYAVPAGKSAFISYISIQSQVGKSLDVSIFVRRDGDTVSAPFSPSRVIASFDGVAGFIHAPFTAPIFVPEKSDIFALCALTSGANGQVNVKYEMFIGDNTIAAIT